MLLRRSVLLGCLVWLLCLVLLRRSVLLRRPDLLRRLVLLRRSLREQELDLEADLVLRTERGMLDVTAGLAPPCPGRIDGMSWTPLSSAWSGVPRLGDASEQVHAGNHASSSLEVSLAPSTTPNQAPALTRSRSTEVRAARCRMTSRARAGSSVMIPSTPKLIMADI